MACVNQNVRTSNANTHKYSHEFRVSDFLDFHSIKDSMNRIQLCINY